MKPPLYTPEFIAFRCIVLFWIVSFIFHNLLTGCLPVSHQKGGNASQSTGPVMQTMIQPENPESPATQQAQSQTITIDEKGTIRIEKHSSGTEIGGSQDLAEIIKSYLSIRYFIAVGLCALAWFWYRKEWPTPALLALIGAGLVIYLGPLIGILIAGGGFAVIYGWKMKPSVIP